MKTLAPKSVVVFCMMFCSLSVYAQKDHVITVKGDTIKCNVKYALLDGNIVKYKPAGSKDYIRIKPDEIKEFSWGPKRTVRAVKTGKLSDPQFMELLESGKIDLYSYEITAGSFVGPNMTMTSSVTTYWYCNKAPVDTVMALKTDDWSMGKSRKSRKEDFGDMLKDNSVVYAQYATQKKFSFMQIRKLIHLYNTGQELAEEPDIYR